MSKVYLVVIDSAGLTTNMSDLESFIRYVKYYFFQNDQLTLALVSIAILKKIIIDTLAHDNQVHVVECAEEIVKLESLFKFDGREKLFHRSKMLPSPTS